MKIQHLIPILFLAAFCTVSAQTVSITQHQLDLVYNVRDLVARSNYFSAYHSRQELEDMTNAIQLVLTNSAAQSNYYSYFRVSTGKGMYPTNAAPDTNVQQWPDDLRKPEALQHIADALDSAFDVQQIDSVCENIKTNLPLIRRFEKQPDTNGPVIVTSITNNDVAAKLKIFSEKIVFYLKQSGQNITSTNLGTFRDILGYQADISVQQGIFHYVFWDGNGLVENFEERTPDDLQVIARANFFGNGKLAGFRLVSPPESITFGADGRMASYRGIVNGMLMDLRPDETGKIKLLGFSLKQ
jgi:hypothetical protein